jgi:alkanesulfonate monooxygenase SsuD/methylene tetrahydromethanopterin reductase-like flavin-dependent oxidoreductase (luciferase family)
VKIGITLPQFRDEADTAIESARRAEELGFDGVFCFDHLWPMGRPDRPALSSGPLLGALATTTSSISVGTLVARVGLVSDEVLVATVSSLSVISRGRMIAGIGTGDHLSRPENLAFGVPYESVDKRRSRVLSVGAAVRDLGIPVWVGGGLPKTIDLARELRVAVNLWGAEPIRVAELTTTGMEVTWGGPVSTSVTEAAARLGELEAAGATWAVCAWPESLEGLARAVQLARHRG